MSVVKVLEALGAALVCVMSSRYYLHMLQQEHYKLPDYMVWLGKHREKFLGWTLNVGVIASLAYYVVKLIVAAFNMGDNGVAEAVSAVVILIGFFCAAVAVNRRQYSEPVKKPLVFTARMKRLMGALAFVAVAVSLLISWAGLPPYLLFVGVPYLACAAGYCMQPVEKRIYQYYIDDAKAVLKKRPDLIKIGITGSFGKTSVKALLDCVLTEKYEVLATPGSENVPMSLSRLIRETLGPQHQVFLAEMGTRNPGDIRELCDLVHPRFGVITSVGAQHLERFGSVENVSKAKFELIEGLPEDGCAFFLADGAWCDKLYEKTHIEKYRAGLSGGRLSTYAEAIESGSFGSRFTLCDAEGGKVRCEMRLLGRHNVQNAVLAACVAKRLGMTLEEIARGLKKAQPVEHRLQLMDNPGGMTIIDDAYNCNPVGAENALEVLRQFPGRRIIVTPGMVEQGEFEEELNRRFGTQLFGSCDVAILVGKKHVQPIAQGALAAGFDKNNLYVVTGIGEAQKILAEIGRADDVVLFENDLTDNYSE